MFKPKLSSKLVFVILSLFWFASVFAQNKIYSDSIPYTSKVNYTVGDRPNSVFCADLNNDGALDIVVSNENENTIAILYNQGNGTFQDTFNYPVGPIPQSLYCADLDNDECLDIVVPHHKSGIYYVSILINNCDTTFQEPDTYSVGEASHAIFCEDLNGDSTLDLAVANKLSNSVSILFNDGSGKFWDRHNYPVGTWPRSIIGGDWDKDNDEDLAVSCHTADKVYILYNDGNGGFDSLLVKDVGDDPAVIHCGDLDSDGWLDLAVPNEYSDNISIMWNDKTGNFQTQDILTGVYQPFGSFIADINSDGSYDLVVTNRGSNTISIFKNEGNGSFEDPIYYQVGTEPISVFCADLDNDGDSDMVVANLEGDNVSVLLNLIICNDPDSDGVCSEGLVAYYPFNGNVNDESGRGFNGIIHGNIEFDDGIYGQAADFDGNDSTYIEVPANGQLSFDARTQSYTISLWFNANQLNYGPIGNNMLISDNRVGGWYESVSYRIGVDRAGDPIIPSERWHRPWANIWTSSNHQNYGIFSPDSIETGVCWYHVVEVITSNNEHRLYINGLLQDSKSIAGISNTKENPGSITIGTCFYSDYMQSWNGLIDEVSIYNRALSEEEIQALYFHGSGLTDYFLFSPLNYDSVKVPITATWQATTCPIPYDTIRYDLYLGRYADSINLYKDSLLDTTFTIGGDLDIGLWYWGVKAYDLCSSEKWSDTLSFYVYLCGDCNGDGQISVSDVICEINYLFKGGTAPVPYIAGDVNCDGQETVSDVVYKINYLFKGGPKPCEYCP